MLSTVSYKFQADFTWKSFFIFVAEIFSSVQRKQQYLLFIILDCRWASLRSSRLRSPFSKTIPLFLYKMYFMQWQFHRYVFGIFMQINIVSNRIDFCRRTDWIKEIWIRNSFVPAGNGSFNQWWDFAIFRFFKENDIALCGLPLHSTRGPLH